MAKGNTTTKAPKVPEKTGSASAASKSSGGLKAFVPHYLLAYNVLSAIGWAYVLALLLAHLSNIDGSQSSVVPESARAGTSTVSRLLSSLPFLSKSQTLTASALESKVPVYLKPLYRRAITAYSRVGQPVTIVQTFAILEVAHVALRLVKSALPTTAMQVSSRLFLVWGVLHYYPHTRTDPLFASMVFAWSMTEVIRYSFYGASLSGKEFPFLTYLRYTTFYVLYPIGALSEAGLIYATLPAGPIWKYGSILDYVRLVFTFIWIPGLAVMMLHMQKQRSKVLGPGLAYKGRVSKGSKAL